MKKIASEHDEISLLEAGFLLFLGLVISALVYVTAPSSFKQSIATVPPPRIDKRVSKERFEAYCAKLRSAWTPPAARDPQCEKPTTE